MRGVAYSLAERELLMRMHQQGKIPFGFESRDGHRPCGALSLVDARPGTGASGARAPLAAAQPIARPVGTGCPDSDLATAKAWLGPGADCAGFGHRPQQCASRAGAARTQPLALARAENDSTLRKEPTG